MRIEIDPKREERLATGVAVGAVLAVLAVAAIGAAAQQRSPASSASYTGLVTLTLADAEASTGAVAGVDADFAATARCVAVFSGTDAANDVDLEGTVDGTNWHVIDTADPDAAAFELFTDTTGPWDQIRANVVALGGGVDVTVTCLATVR